MSEQAENEQMEDTQGTKGIWERFWTSYQLGKLLNVNPSSVNKWANEGHIQYFRTPGGHRRFRATAVMEFRKKMLNGEFGAQKAKKDPDACAGKEEVPEVPLTLAQVVEAQSDDEAE